MSLWAGESLETGLDDTHTEQAVRISVHVLPGMVAGFVPGLRKDVCLAGAKITPCAEAKDAVIVQGAEPFSRPITLQPAGEPEHRQIFGTAVAAARRLTPCFDAIVYVSVSRGPFSIARVTLTSNKQRALLELKPCAISGMQAAGIGAWQRPRGIQGRPSALKPGTESPLWAKCAPLDAPAGKVQLLKFRKSAVVACTGPAPGASATAEVGTEGKATGAPDGQDNSSGGSVKVLGMRLMQRTVLGKVQSLLPFSIEVRPVPTEALAPRPTTVPSPGKAKPKSEAKAEGEDEDAPAGAWPPVPLATYEELACAFSDISALLNGTWPSIVTRQVTLVQAAVRGWAVRRKARLAAARRSRVIQAAAVPAAAAPAAVAVVDSTEPEVSPVPQAPATTAEEEAKTDSEPGRSSTASAEPGAA